MKRPVAGQPAFERRPEEKRPEHDSRGQDAAPERIRHERIAGDAPVEPGNEAQRSDQPAEVPVGLRAVRRLRDVVRPPLPDRVDLDETAEQEQHRGGREQQPNGLRRLTGERRRAAHLLLRLPTLRELRVVPRSDEQVHAEQQSDQDREQENVRDVHARPEVGRAGERTAPDQRGEIRADERDREQYAVADRETHSRQQVVDERVAEVALEQRDREHREADVVRQVARLAERPREEDPQQMEDDRDDEDVGGPVVRLADQQAGAHLEREVDDRPVRLGHPEPAQRLVRPVVVRLRRAGVEEEGQVDAGRDEHEERVQRHFAEQERPVIGEDVAERLFYERRRRGTFVEVADRAADHGAAGPLAPCRRTPHQDGPTGPEKLPAARSSPFPSTSSGSCGSGRPAGPNSTVPPVAGSNVE